MTHPHPFPLPEGAEGEGQADKDKSIEWTCPMHPEIIRDAPGNCGMALEPRTVSLVEEENPELVDMTRRFWVSTLWRILFL